MRTGYIKHISALLLFGSNGIVASYIELSSFEIVFWRTSIGSFFLMAAFALSGGKAHIPENKKHLGYLAVSGVAMGASWMFLYEAYTQIGVSVATLAYYCGPVIVMFLAPLLFRERITWIKIFGFIAVFTGMFLVNGELLLQGGFSTGLICGILSAVMYAIMVVFNKKASSIAGLENSLCQLTVSFFTVALFALIKQGATISIPPQSVCPILLLGVVNTGIGCYLYFSSIQQLSAQTVSICGYLEPLSALVFSAAFLHERLTLTQIAGAALILGGAAFGELLGRERTKSFDT